MKKTGIIILVVLSLSSFTTYSSPPNLFDKASAQSAATIPVGNSPAGVAYDSAKGEIFVANFNVGTVSVISDSTNTVVATIPVGIGPNFVAYDSAKGEIFVANRDSLTVSVISDSTNTVVATIPVGDEPAGVAYDSAKGEIFVANPSSNTVSVIRDSDNTVVATVTVGDEPAGVAYDSAKGEIFVANFNVGTVSVISDSTNTVVATIPVGIGPNFVAYDSAKGEIFVANRDSVTVSVISDSTNTVVATIPVGYNPGPAGIAYDSAKGEIFVAYNNFASVSVISDSTNTVVATIPVGPSPVGVAYDSAKGEIFVTNSYSNTVSVIQTTVSSPLPTHPETTQPLANATKVENPISVGLISSLTLDLSLQSVNLGERLVVTGNVTSSSAMTQMPIVKLNFTKPDGFNLTSSVIPNTNGVFTYELNPDQKGVWKVQAYTDGIQSKSSSFEVGKFANWPMVGYDSGHSSYTDEATGPPFTLQWNLTHYDAPLKNAMTNLDPNWTGETYTSAVIDDNKLYLTIVTDYDVSSESFRNIPHRETFVAAYGLNDGKLLWMTNLGRYGSLTGTITLSNGFLYIPLINERENVNRISALNSTTGKTVWSYDASYQSTISTPTPWRWGVTPEDGKVFVGFTDGKLYAFDAITGKLIWNQNTFTPPSDFPENLKHWIMAFTPSVSGDTVIIPSSDLSLYAFDINTGKLKWNAPLEFSGHSMATVHDGVIYFVSNNKVSSMKVSSGEKLWNYVTSEQPNADQEFTEFATIGKGVLYAMLHDGTIYAFDSASGKIKWTIKSNATNILHSPLANDRFFILSDNAGNLYGLNPADGKVAWHQNIPKNYPTNIYPQIILGRGMLVSLTEGPPQSVYVFKGTQPEIPSVESGTTVKQESNPIAIRDGVTAKFAYDGLNVYLTLTFYKERADQAKTDPLFIYGILDDLSSKQKEILDWASNIPGIGQAFSISKFSYTVKSIWYMFVLWDDALHAKRSDDGSLTVTLMWDATTSKLFTYPFLPGEPIPITTELPEKKSLITAIFSHANILITAPDGKRLGTDPATGQAIHEIDGFYTGPNTEPQAAVIFDPQDGQYTVQVIPLDSGIAHLAYFLGSEDKQRMTSTMVEMNLQQGETQTSTLNVSNNVLTVPEFSTGYVGISMALTMAAMLLVVKLRIRSRNTTS